ncbi:DUF2171 domain-containing protein [Deinococcus cavernae]|nr:DUF2171 domain-containing protein [Deinococcus cavernae]
MDNITPGLPIICTDDLIFAHAEGVEHNYVRTAPMPDGQRHYIPLEIVGRVGDGVYLTVSSEELRKML